jgi:sulfate permease, SulP family
LSRFLPYPVIGGFLAGTGWLLVAGAIEFTAGVHVTAGGLATLSSGGVLVQWLPGLILALGMLLLTRRFRHFWLLPASLLVSAGLFFASGSLLGWTLSDLSAGGWLIGPFPAGISWRPFTPMDFGQVDWSVLGALLPNVPGLVLVSLVAALLNVSGLEAGANRDVDLNRELNAAGLGNILSSLVGGLPGYQQLSLSILSIKVGAETRLTALVAAAVVLVALVFGATIMAQVPKVIAGALLLYLGLSFLYEWLVEAWFRFSKVDYAIIVGIVIVIAAVGFLEGVLVGLVAAVIMFVVAYSRVDVVRHTLTGSEFRSRVTRSRAASQFLAERGHEIFILELEGFIFFGTAHGLLERVWRRLQLEGMPVVRYVILDFARVTGFDSTAMRSFDRLRQLARRYGFVLVFSGGSDELEELWRQNGFDGADPDAVRMFTDLDHALEWSESQVLSRSTVNFEAETDLLAWLQSVLPGEMNVAALLPYLDAEEVPAGHYLMRQGEAPDHLFFVVKGQVSARLESSHRPAMRLETMTGGQVVGELGFYLGSERTAAVIADEPSLVYRLTADSLTRMESEAPEAASILHRIIVRLLAERVTRLVGTVQAFQR